MILVKPSLEKGKMHGLECARKNKTMGRVENENGSMSSLSYTPEDPFPGNYGPTCW